MATDPIFEQFKQDLITKGLEQGKALTRRADLILVLVERFNAHEEVWRARLDGLDEAELDVLFRASLRAETLDQVQNAFEAL